MSQTSEREHMAEVDRELRLFAAFVRKRIIAKANEAALFHAWATVIGTMVPQIPCPWPPNEAIDLIAEAMKEAAQRYIAEKSQ